ncbi:hypothetical protein K8R04_02655 [Candidatus Uhrbacteria bacterium]|nr:hypothetical protein [Candidatus Uhrbacteria bacterium]
MPEFLLAALILGGLAAMKYQQIRFIFTHFKRSFSRDQPTSVHVDPYRNNPEVERDCARRRADLLEAQNAKLQGELVEVRMERDLALQQRSLSVLKGRVVYGGAFALGALTCFTSVNIAPQIASDLLADRPAHVRSTRIARIDRDTSRDDLMIGLLTMGQRYHPYGMCAPETCCPRARIRLVAFGEFVLRLDPVTVPLEFFWRRPPEIADTLVVTSGGEEPPTQPQDSTPTWIDYYALPAGREQLLPIVTPMAISITLD